MNRIPTLNRDQGYMARLVGFREGVDFTCYDQVPLGRFDLVFCQDRQRWVDRRTTDGEILASDGRNARAA